MLPEAILCAVVVRFFFVSRLDPPKIRVEEDDWSEVANTYSDPVQDSVLAQTEIRECLATKRYVVSSVSLWAPFAYHLEVSQLLLNVRRNKSMWHKIP